MDLGAEEDPDVVPLHNTTFSPSEDREETSDTKEGTCEKGETRGKLKASQKRKGRLSSSEPLKETTETKKRRRENEPTQSKTQTKCKKRKQEKDEKEEEKEDVPMDKEETLTEAVGRVFRVCEINESKVADTVASLQRGDISLKALIGGKTTRKSLESMKFSPGICDALLSLCDHAPAPALDQHPLDPGWEEIRETDLGQEIGLPRRVPNEPPFLCQERWLEEKIQTIWDNFIAKDEDRGEESRIKPMALVRCSRGGKTRALKEIAYGIKEKADQKQGMENFRVISISFNDFSPPSDWEKKHPTKAICRRIAFAALFEGKEGLSEQFKKFEKTASKETILSWLGENKEEKVPCILLIDELNALEMKDRTKEATDCASFLKECFLTPANRYLVFTSHIFSPAKILADYMDNQSKRGVDIEELPIIENVRSVQQQFEFPGLTARMALYYGLAPSLIYLSNRNQVPDLKESELSCTSDLSDSEVRSLFKNFFTGNRREFPEKLNSILSLMSVGPDGVLHWIPCFMVEVLKKFSSCGQLSGELGVMLGEISDLFTDFKRAQEGSGSAWESLFVIALLLRCLSHHFDGVILPLDRKFTNASVSYNKLLNQSFTDLRTIGELVSALNKPEAFPHIAVFYPNHANFEMIDVLVAVYPDADSRSLYGYQLKEHNEIPNRKPPAELGDFFVIRGQSTNNPLGPLRNWHRPSTQQIKNFFGESGMHWTPERWRELSV